MRTTRSILLTVCIFFLAVNTAFSQSLIEPIQFPTATISINQPYFIWQDIYNSTRDKSTDVRYRLTLYTTNKKETKLNSYTFHPDLYYNFFYSFRIPDILKDDSYRYSIERIISGNPVESRYYYYLKYPIVQEFSINSEIKNEVDSLPPEYLIQYLHIDRNNTLRNGYNFLFFSSSGLASFVIGMLFYHVIDLGTISTIIYTVSFISSGVGISAAGYYGYHYMKNRGKLQRILEINRRISINGGIRDKKVNAEVEFSF
jgi:hypothetical protein